MPSSGGDRTANGFTILLPRGPRRRPVAKAMDDPDDLVDLGLTSTLHIHASGALTFLGAGEGPALWDDDLDLSLLALPA